ncbi:EAL domain-containing protein [Stappia sp. F7233]|uniref:cyclic-guanylate-specific phosphodiesterase n=1 Tax=Stappia albiluteola TaxID=2758565 RepID=A0A839AFT2_9HYPH|nr:EAL domain-containing protein [Stappia albiluteola]MBA5777794.1 EAL domain-containing protein [Stappia albiluteola]
MTVLAKLFLSARQLRLIATAIWIAVSCSVISAGIFYIVLDAREDLKARGDMLLEEHARFSRTAIELLDILNKQPPSEPCGPAFLEYMRKAAFLPDGINTILYSEGGNVVCSANSGRLATPVSFGAPDVAAEDTPYGIEIWFDRPQSGLGLPGETGSLVGRGGFLVVIPAASAVGPAISKESLDYEVVMTLLSGAAIHRGGTTGLHEALRDEQAGFSFGDMALQISRCGDLGLFCVTVHQPLAQALPAFLPQLIAFVLIGAICGSASSRYVERRMRRYWSFEERFVRNLGFETVNCAYQPVMEVATGKIVGLEVLARWRDIDGQQVYPDQFLPVIQMRGLTRRFTEIVIAKAKAELADHIPEECQLQVAFNIFPRDYSYEFLFPLLGERVPGTIQPRFDYVLEIVETDSFDVASVKKEMTMLRRHGIRTFIDDFGIGFSNIGTLAELPIDGVKLDRSFAMAADGSLFANMLPRALELIGSAGHRVVVEGIETRQRLEALSASPHVEFAQGYFIGRPMPVDKLSMFLAEYCGKPDSLLPPQEIGPNGDKIVPIGQHRR